MIDLRFINGFFPRPLRDNPAMAKHMLKEYVQLMVLDHLSSTSFAGKLAFIGGTNLRLIKGIDRFSEDLDFDCKGLGEDEFMTMTDGVVAFLRREGLNVEVRDKPSGRLTAFRRSLHFPHLLFDMGLTGHREERFLLKIEAQDQGVGYRTQLADVVGCGFFFPLPVPPDGVLLAMKLAALLARRKGRDFYDVMFLMGQTTPDYEFLRARCGIATASELSLALADVAATTDLQVKKRDFDHLLLNPLHGDRILRFAEYCKHALK